MAKVASSRTSSTPVRHPRLTAAVVDFRVAVWQAICRQTPPLSVLYEFRPLARQLGVSELLWLTDEIHRLTHVNVRGY